MKSQKRILALVLALLLLALAACDKTSGGNQPDQPTDQQNNQQQNHQQPTSQREDIHTAKSADELYQLFTATYEDYSYTDMIKEDAEPTEDSSMENNYGTNIQVDGYDEGDIVKTDGTYLYILGAADLKIVSADGESTQLLSTTNVLVSGGADSYETTSALYVYGSTVAVISTAEIFYSDDVYFSYEDQCHVKFYDVSDPTAPKLIGTTVQDGNYRDSRMADGKIYVASVDYKFSPEEDMEPTYMPCVWEDGVAEPLSLDRIFVCPDDRASSYTVVSMVDMATAQCVDSCAFTGDSNSIYMDDTGLYLARIVYTDEESEPYTEDQYSVVSVQSSAQTEIKKLTTDGGSLVLAAEAYVDGCVLNQYSMDVYNGNLRIATSSDRSGYKIYTDEKYGWSNYQPGDSDSGNNVFILDANLNQIGAVTGFAQGEEIYSARFLGDIAFVVTYVQTDPLFAIDLTDPTAPKILDELKVTGVSDYLHLYQDGKLFGLGVSEDWSLQAEMFDVSDPENISLETQLVLSGYDWTAALNNPRAILINASQNLIAFPADSAYVVLGYEGQTLTERGTFQFEYYTERTRGMLIGDTVYICDPQAVTVVAADTLTEIANIQFGVG